MANSSLESRSFAVSDELIKTLKTNLKKYGNDNPKGAARARNLLRDKKVSYSEIKRIKNFFDNYDGDGNDLEYKMNGGDVGEKWCNNTLSSARDSVHNVKQARMNAGEENQFLKTHNKDKMNANPTHVGMVKIHKGSQMRNIMNNTTVYESELNKINQLIKKMNNG